MVLVSMDHCVVDIAELDIEISQQDRQIGMDFGVMIFGEDIVAEVREHIVVEDMDFLVVAGV